MLALRRLCQREHHSCNNVKTACRGDGLEEYRRREVIREKTNLRRNVVREFVNISKKNGRHELLASMLCVCATPARSLQ